MACVGFDSVFCIMSDSDSDIEERHAKLIESLSKSDDIEKKSVRSKKQTKVKNEITKESEYSIDTDRILFYIIYIEI